jgi:hypothetical protein
LKIESKTTTKWAPKTQKTQSAKMPQNVFPMQLSRRDGDIFDYSMQITSKGGHTYCLYGHDLNLRNHFGAIYCLSSEMWLGALDFVDISSTSCKDDDEDSIVGRGIFVFAETSCGSDNLKIVFFCKGE